MLPFVDISNVSLRYEGGADGTLEPAFSGDGRGNATVTGDLWQVGAIVDDGSGRPIVGGANRQERMILLRFRAPA